jgi:hypothetical protein
MKLELEKALEEYNRYRSPESKASLVEFEEEGFKVKFEGSFCASCGVYDWFDDLRYELMRFGIESKITEFEKVGERSFLVKFRVNKRAR